MPSYHSLYLYCGFQVVLAFTSFNLPIIKKTNQNTILYIQLLMNVFKICENIMGMTALLMRFPSYNGRNELKHEWILVWH